MYHDLFFILSKMIFLLKYHQYRTVYPLSSKSSEEDNGIRPRTFFLEDWYHGISDTLLMQKHWFCGNIFVNLWSRIFQNKHLILLTVTRKYYTLTIFDILSFTSDEKSLQRIFSSHTHIF